MQLSKLVWAAAFVAGAAASGHHVHKRDAPRPAYPKVSRDSEYGAPVAPSFSSSGSSFSFPSSYSAPPATSYSAPAPAPSYSAPAPSYSAPAPSYSAPASSYSAPSTSYAAPSSSYGAPAASYGAPEVSYGSTVYEEDTGKGIDLTSIIIPILALIGLSLLFPTYVSLTTVRKKRTLDLPGEGELSDQWTNTLKHISLIVFTAAAATTTTTQNQRNNTRSSTTRTTTTSTSPTWITSCFCRSCSASALPPRSLVTTSTNQPLPHTIPAVANNP